MGGEYTYYPTSIHTGASVTFQVPQMHAYALHLYLSSRWAEHIIIKIIFRALTFTDPTLPLDEQKKHSFLCGECHDHHINSKDIDLSSLS